MSLLNDLFSLIEDKHCYYIPSTHEAPLFIVQEECNKIKQMLGDRSEDSSGRDLIPLI